MACICGGLRYVRSMLVEISVHQFQHLAVRPQEVDLAHQLSSALINFLEMSTHGALIRIRSVDLCPVKTFGQLNGNPVDLFLHPLRLHIVQ
eukprot:9131510-Pyramimonas_sp.AAC.1